MAYSHRWLEAFEILDRNARRLEERGSQIIRTNISFQRSNISKPTLFGHLLAAKILVLSISTVYTNVGK